MLFASVYWANWYFSLSPQWQIIVTVIEIIGITLSMGYGIYQSFFKDETKMSKKEKAEFEKFVEDYYAGRLNYRGGQIK